MHDLLQAQARLDQKRQSLKILQPRTTEKIKSPNPGEKISKICNKHGEYQSEAIIFEGVTIWSRCPSCEAEHDEAEKQRAAKNNAQRVADLSAISGVPLRYRNSTLGNWLVSSKKQETILVATKLYFSRLTADGEGASLVLLGKPGTGKTHLACAIAKDFISETGLPALYINASELLRRVKSTYSPATKRTEEEVYNYFNNLRLLVVDDIGVQYGSNAEKNILHEIINTRYERILSTILISNLSLAELTAIVGERSIDRLNDKNGSVLVFNWDSHRSKP